jgi:DNA uptake protein ComE-like DNA-binding protein
MRAKLEPGELVDLNTADTTALMRVPGIGAVRARRIVAYRQSLGGYHSIAQVYEACDLPEDLGDWVHIGTPQTVKLNVNTMSITELRAHPYLSYHQARAIVELRRREGDIRSLRQLLFLDEFAEADAARLAPYLTF